MSDTVTSLVKGNESLNRQFVGYGTDIFNRRIIVENINFRNSPVVVKSKDLNNYEFIILNHPVCGFLGLKLSGDANPAFDDFVIDKFVNKNNLFKESFYHTDFVDSTVTTASINTSTGVMSFDGGEVYQSSVIAKNNVAYTRAIVSGVGVVDDLNLSVSFDGGSTFTDTAFDELLSVSNSSVEGLVVKIVATSSASSSADYLSSLSVDYS